MKPCQKCGEALPVDRPKMRFCVACTLRRKAAYNRQHNADNRDKYTTRLRERYRANPEAFRAKKNKSYHRDQVKKLIALARGRAREKALSFDIDASDVVIPTRCPVFGITLTSGAGGLVESTPTLDRIDNNRGYVRGNVAVVSWRANRIKSDANSEELRSLADFYSRRRAE